MTRPTDTLIGELAADARPVRRLAPPGLRAAVWLMVVLGLAAVITARFGDVAGTLARTDRLAERLAFFGALLTGLTGVTAASHLAVPDRSRRWALAPLPPLALWLGASGLGCIGLAARPDGDSATCLKFILASGAILGALLFWRLRRAAPLQPRLVGAIGALGIAGLSATVLQFFHPFAITWLDLGVHLVGFTLLLIAATLIGPRALGRRRAL